MDACRQHSTWLRSLSLVDVRNLISAGLAAPLHLCTALNAEQGMSGVQCSPRVAQDASGIAQGGYRDDVAACSAMSQVHMQIRTTMSYTHSDRVRSWQALLTLHLYQRFMVVALYGLRPCGCMAPLR